MVVFFRGVILFWLAIVAAACVAGDGAAASPSSAAVDTVAERPVIDVPLTLYRVIDLDAAGLGTARTTEEIEAIGVRVNEIWSHADIRFEPIFVRDLDVSAGSLAPIASSGDIELLFEELRASPPEDPGLVNGFYVDSAFGVNGFVPSGTRVFLIVDEPTVPDHRVTSHEIGHIFGLHHTAQDTGRLMFSGTDGEQLTDEEQTVGRYFAQGILDGDR